MACLLLSADPLSLRLLRYDQLDPLTITFRGIWHPLPQSVGYTVQRAVLINLPACQWRDCHYKDKTVLRTSYLYDATIPWNMAFILKQGLNVLIEIANGGLVQYKDSILPVKERNPTVEIMRSYDDSLYKRFDGKLFSAGQQHKTCILDDKIHARYVVATPLWVSKTIQWIYGQISIQLSYMFSLTSIQWPG